MLAIFFLDGQFRGAFQGHCINILHVSRMSDDYVVLFLNSLPMFLFDP